MFSFKYLSKTIHYYFVILVSFVLIILSNVFFINEINENKNAINTFSNFTSERISYDKGSDLTNSYEFFDDNAYALGNIETKETINAKIYQFMNDKIYDDVSILNSKNIYKGTYKVLEKNEACISNKISEKFNLNIGDFIYINEDIKCKIVYITNEFYKIGEIDFSSKESSIFIGKDTLPKSVVNSYCNFLVKTGEMRNDVKIISNLRKNLKNRYIFINIAAGLITIITLVSFNLIRLSFGERKAFYDFSNNGMSHVFLNICANELCYIIPLYILSTLLIFLGHMNLIHIIVMLFSVLVSGLIHIIIIQFARKKNYGR